LSQKGARSIEATTRKAACELVGVSMELKDATSLPGQHDEAQRFLRLNGEQAEENMGDGECGIICLMQDLKARGKAVGDSDCMHDRAKFRNSVTSFVVKECQKGAAWTREVHESLHVQQLGHDTVLSWAEDKARPGA